MHFSENILKKDIFKIMPKLFCFAFITILLILKPSVASYGIKNGISLLLNTVIPSLFPFLVLSSYIALSPAFLRISSAFKFFTNKFFKINEIGFIPMLLGILGGYPIGAKVTSDLYKNKMLTENEAERLMYFAVNSGPAFTITAVGVSMLGNYYSGLILYASSLLTTLTLGFLCRFLSDKKQLKQSFENADKDDIFINSVASGANSAINISSWIMTFSCISALFNDFNFSHNVKLFVNSLLEVTSACKMCADTVSLPVISAILGFGGFSVIFQVSPYLKDCNVELKKFITARILNASISAFYTYQIVKIFPEAVETVTFSLSSISDEISAYGIITAIILLLMCIILILQVDNRRKVC